MWCVAQIFTKVLIKVKNSYMELSLLGSHSYKVSAHLWYWESSHDAQSWSTFTFLLLRIIISLLCSTSTSKIWLRKSSWENIIFSLGIHSVVYQHTPLVGEKKDRTVWKNDSYSFSQIIPIPDRIASVHFWTQTLSSFLYWKVFLKSRSKLILTGKKARCFHHSCIK